MSMEHWCCEAERDCPSPRRKSPFQRRSVNINAKWTGLENEPGPQRSTTTPLGHDTTLPVKNKMSFV
jgi:hypothetical protein